jgi:polar amino acid transport system permease protein
MIFDKDYAVQIAPVLIHASWVTLEATVLGTLLAAVVGLLLSMLRRSRFSVIRRIAWGYISFVRSTPLLIQIFVLFYVLPLYGLRLPAFLTGTLALGFHYGSYMAEVYRAGIDAVPRGQWEAAYTLNMPPWLIWTRVVLPQAIPPVIPPLGNYMVSMFKDTPLLSTIGILELLGSALSEASLTFRYYEPLTLVGLIFLFFSLLSTVVIRRLESRFGTSR